MKILLVALNAKYIHSNLAVRSLVSYAAKYSGRLDVLELTINHPEEEILKEIYRKKADIVAFSCYIWNIAMVSRIIRELRKVQPEVKIWLGGPEVSYDADRYLKGNTAADGIVIGEGERTFLELVRYYIEGRAALEDIKGLAFKDSARIKSDPAKNCNTESALDSCTESNEDSGTDLNADSGNDFCIDSGEVPNTGTGADSVEVPNTGTGADSGEVSNTGTGADIGHGQVQPMIIQTAHREQLSLDEVPFPYENMGAFQNRIIYYESSRGCPFSCSYCLSSIDRKVRLRSIGLVKRELLLLLENKVPQVKFVDRTFNCNKKHAMEIWSFIKEHDNGITNFHFEISADLLEEDELDFLATLRPGQVQFEIGVQSTNPDTIAAIHRNMDYDKLSRNVRRIKEGRNIHVHLDLIAGLPLEGYASFEKSFHDVYQLRPDQLQLGFLKLLKGSLMEEEQKVYGITCRSTPPYEVLYTDHLTYEEVLAIKGACEMVEIYYNSGQFTASIRFLEQYYDSPMKLYQAIHEYYDRKAISLMAHSRIKRYEILLDFYKEVVLESIRAEDRPDLEELFKEILIYDLYLREDLKSRPSFCTDKPKKNQLKALYEKYQADRNSIHIEMFSFDVEASAVRGTAVRKETAILFDYGSRDPLSYGAKTEILKLELDVI